MTLTSTDNSSFTDDVRVKSYNPTGGSIAGPTGALRFASAANRFANTPQAPAAAFVLGCANRHKHVIGSGDLSEIRLLDYNCYVWLGSINNPGNTRTITDAFIEIGGTTVRVTYGGLNGSTMADGAFGLVSDAVLPSSFSLAKFAKGTVFYVRYVFTIPNTGSAVFPIIPQWPTNYSGDTSSGGNYYNTVLTSPNNLTGQGDITYTGVAPSFTNGYTPLVIGKFTSGDPRTFICAGDSVSDGVGDVGDGFGIGFFERALFNGSNATALAGVNISRSSGTAQAWTSSPALTDLCKYANGLVEEYGTNNFDNTANGNASTVNFVIGLSSSIWSTCRTNASAVAGTKSYKVIRTKLLCRTNTPTDNTPAGQTVYGPKWDVAGNADDFNTGTVTGPDVFIAWDTFARFNQTVGNANYYKWINGLASTADGTHPVRAIHVSMAAILNAQMG